MDGVTAGQGDNGALAVAAVESVWDSAANDLDWGGIGERLPGSGFQGSVSAVYSEIGAEGIS